jgi:hypothetical protein
MHRVKGRLRRVFMARYSAGLPEAAAAGRPTAVFGLYHKPSGGMCRKGTRLGRRPIIPFFLGVSWPLPERPIAPSCRRSRPLRARPISSRGRVSLKAKAPRHGVSGQACPGAFPAVPAASRPVGRPPGPLLSRPMNEGVNSPRPAAEPTFARLPRLSDLTGPMSPSSACRSTPTSLAARAPARGPPPLQQLIPRRTPRSAPDPAPHRTPLRTLPPPLAPPCPSPT